jgi:hypothetical protein
MLHTPSTTAMTMITAPNRKTQLSRPRCSLVVNVKMDIWEIGIGVLTGLVWLRIGTSGEFL